MKGLFLIFFLIILSFSLVYGTPQLPLTVDGQVVINGNTAKSGTKVELKIDEKVVKTLEIGKNGRFVTPIEGSSGDVVEIYVNGIKSSEVIFEHGKIEKINLDVEDYRLLYILGGILFVVIVGVVWFAKFRKIYKRN
jgi:hypothetical protein